MKNSIYMAIFLLMLFVPTEMKAQISLGSMKEKAESKAKQKAKSKSKEKENEVKESAEDATRGTTPSTTSSDDDQQSQESFSDTEKEKAAIRKSPASSQLWDLRSDLQYMEGRVGQTDFQDNLEKVKKRYDAVRKFTPTTARLQVI